MKLTYVQNGYFSGSGKKHVISKAAERSILMLGTTSLNVTIFLPVS